MPLARNRILFFIIFLLLFSLKFSVRAQTSAGVVLKTVVIDAGHGGNDPGAISLDRKLLEKDVTLSIATKLGNLIKKSCPDVKVIYTRSKDIYVPLDTRSDIANKNHADLFISIHCNSVPKGKSAPSGCETFIMGMHKSGSNLEVCKIENSVILLEDDYTTKYQGYNPNDPESFIFFNLMQNANLEQSLEMAALCQENLKKSPINRDRGIKQGGLLVLWKTTMPAILVEVGFISNQNDRNILASDQKRNLIASQLFSAFQEFKKQYEAGNEEGDTLHVKQAEIPAQEINSPEVHDDELFYSVQVFALSRKLKPGSREFKGYDNINTIKVGSLYKYSIGQFKTEEQAVKNLPEIKKKFQGAFVIKIKNNTIIN